METSKLKKFAQFARRSLIEQVTSKVTQVLDSESIALREQPKAVHELEKQIKQYSKEQVIEKVAYIWFNRFCALLFMDVNRYTSIGIVSPTQGQFQPEILADAKMGHIEESMVSEETRQKIFALLNGSIPSRDPQTEGYRLLVVAACNDYHKAMPYLFEHIDDYTELLMPDDLLSGNSILAYTREAMTPDICRDVEVIGWLYQFYISEKKDEVFEGLKKNKKITPENIPAATQLFTPHWIVRYLVENSLGRLWMLNHPNSKLIQQMDYYIKPEQAETDFLHISKPEELKICDPACGSGHMLTYAFDLLHAIYEEEGYETAEIPEKILTHNLYGIEIDERAGELAAFALTMKARNKQRRFFNKKIQPNICVLERINLKVEEEEQTLFNTKKADEKWQQVIDILAQQEINSEHLIHDLNLFEEADNFGSLLKPQLKSEEIKKLIQTAEKMLKENISDMFLNPMLQQCIKALKQAEFLTSRYHIVIANPPYMGRKGMNTKLSAWAKKNYPDSKSDFFAMFIERGLKLLPKFGYSAMVTMQSWMFLSSYEKLRTKLMEQTSIESMTHMANMVMGIAFGTAATVWKLSGKLESRGAFCFVEYEDIGEGNKPIKFPPENERNNRAIEDLDCGWFFRASSKDFKKIPGYPIAYWVSEHARDAFAGTPIGDILTFKQGIATSNNERFLRYWQEIDVSKMDISCKSPNDLRVSIKKWFPYNKGGSYRKWFGNNEFVVNWEHDGYEMKEFTSTLLQGTHVRLKSRDYYCLPCITYSALSSGDFGCRISDAGFLFDTKGSCVFSDQGNLITCSGLLNSRPAKLFLEILCPTLDYSMVGIKQIPIGEDLNFENTNILINGITISRVDWNSYETSWEFTTLPLLHPDYQQNTLNYTYIHLLTHWREMTLEMQRLEEENNSIFIEAYGLQNELTSEVPLKEITLTCNPHYRYGCNKSEEEKEALLLADTMKEFISYAVGCMFGRYSLDKPGLILANQGETIVDYLKQVPEPSFPADDDNVIPILDGDWFADDIMERFFKFLRITFGEEHYEENLQFIEKAIGKNIRKYFLRDFYIDHVKRYKKRPIYWLFSSSKGSFNALIYMHRYRPDTVSVVLNNYLREFRTKLSARLDHLKRVEANSDSSRSEKTKALKEIEKLKKMIREMEDYEREVLYPLATEQVKIDLDDGVKVNYNKFGKALKKVSGLSEK